jgi:glycine oxidase
VASLDESGVDIGYRAAGSLRVAFNPEQAEALAREVDGQIRGGLEAALLGPGEVRELEPALSDAVIAAGYFPRDAVVDPPPLLRAVRVMAERAGVSLVSEAPVVRLLESKERSEERVSGALLENGDAYHGDEVVLAAGSWSALVGESGIPRDALAPARGQMIELRTPTQQLTRVVDGPGAYLSPRVDGRVLVGSTVERAGFEEAVTAGAVRALLDGALAMVPDLANATMSATWCGFRALTPDELPILGRAAPGLVVATGHFRDGILLAPISADVVASLILGESPPLDVTAFAPTRFAAP